MNQESIQQIRDARRINPHKLFPDNPVPYSHIWEITNIIDEKYIINWDTQAIEHAPNKFPELKECYKITEASFQRNPLRPGIYVKVDHETVEFELIEHCKEWKVDGKDYVPYYKIEPTPGRELPPEDNPEAEWTGMVTDGSIDSTDREKEIVFQKNKRDLEKTFYERRTREFAGKKMLSSEQIEYVAYKKPGYEDIVRMYADYVDGKIDQIDPTFIPHGQEYDFDPTD